MSATLPFLGRALRPSSLCQTCRRQLLRQPRLRSAFSGSAARRAASFQAYTLPSRIAEQARNADVPETSIASPTPPPPLPRIHETRPPAALQDGLGAEKPAVALREEEAQRSSKDFVSRESSTASASPSQPTSSSTDSNTKTPAPQQEPPSSSSTASATSTSPKARPRSKLRAPRKAAMRLTPAAVSHLRDMLSEPTPQLIRVGVRNRGCSGLAYHLEYVEKAGAFDETVEQDGVSVLIDSKALFSIIGSEMDWVEDKLSQKFVFRNPNIKEECGCGESFMV